MQDFRELSGDPWGSQAKAHPGWRWGGRTRYFSAVSPQTCSQKSPPKSRAWKIPAREGLESGAGWMVFGPIRLGGNEIIWGPP